MSKKDVVLAFYLLEQIDVIKFEDDVHRNRFIEHNFQYTEMRNTKEKGKVSDMEDVNQVISKLRDSFTKGAVESHNKSKDKLTKTIEDRLQDFLCNLDAHNF